MMEFEFVLPFAVVVPVAVIVVVPAAFLIAPSSTMSEFELTAIEPVLTPMK